MYTTLIHQYQLVLSARNNLFGFCETISADDLLKKLPSFNNESMMSLAMHSANCYMFWLANSALQERRPPFEVDDFKEMQLLRPAFEQVNLVMNEFLHHFKDTLAEPRLITRPDGSQLYRSPLDIFTHVTTHEFHHKGQIVSMSRQLGYTPVDTDVIIE